MRPAYPTYRGADPHAGVTARVDRAAAKVMRGCGPIISAIITICLIAWRSIWKRRR